MSDNQKNLFAFGITVPCVLLVNTVFSYWFLCGDSFEKLFISDKLNKNLFYYISIYFLSLVLFFVLFFFSRRFLSRPTAYNRIISKNDFISQIAICLLVYFISLAFLNENLENDAGSFYTPWHSSKSFEILIIFIGIFILIKGNTLFNRVNSITAKFDNTRVIWVFYMALSIFAAYNFFQLDIMSNVYSVHHFSAFFQSIYRVLHLQPYSEINSGIYGFYGILVAPIIKLLGGTSLATVIVFSIISALFILLNAYIINSLAKPIWLKVIAIIVIITGFTGTSGIYVQHYPHRVIFCAALGAFMVYDYKHPISHHLRTALFFIISVFAVLWNFESGIACICGIAVYSLVRVLQSEFDCKSLILSILKTLLMIIAPIICAFLIISLYNVLVGGEILTIKGFLFAFVGTSYVNNINIDLITEVSAYMLAIAFFITLICFTIYQTKICKEKNLNPKACLYGAFTAMSVIQMLYYINRAVYGNLYSIIPNVVILLILCYGDIRCYIEGRDIHFRFFFNKLKTLAIVVLLFLSFSASVKFVNSFEINNSVYKDRSAYTSFLNQVEQTIPKDTVALGSGADIVYADLGWDNGYYGLDFSDIAIATEEGEIQLERLILNSDKILLADSAMDWMDDRDISDEFYENYNKANVLKYKDTEFYYYVKKE